MNKSCNKCGTNFPATTEFFKADSRLKTGIRNVCLPCFKKQKKQYRQSAQGKAVRERWLGGNKDYFTKWRENNPNYGKDWHDRNPGKGYEGYKRWLNEILTHEERDNYNKAHAHKRRARKLEVGGRFDRHDIKRILEAQKHTCWWCSCRLSKYHMDHRIPIARGGPNTASNLVASCPSCNLKKSAKMPWEMRQNPRLI